MPATLQWTQEEDEKLRQLVEQFGTKAWAKIAGQLRSKGSKQCRRRWKNFLNMSAKTCSWSPEEDATLIDAHRRLGNRWTEISKIFGDRTDNAVKNRWHALTRKHPALENDGGGGGEGGDSDSAPPPRSKRRRTTRHTAKRDLTDDDGNSSDLLDSARYGQSLQQYGSGGPGISAASLPTPFDQPGQPSAVVQQVVPQHRLAQQQNQFVMQPAWYPGQHPVQAQHHAPLQIMVNKDILSPWEQQLADQINAMNLPVHVELAPAPLLAPQDTLMPNDRVDTLSGLDLLVGRGSWKQYVDKLDEPGDSKGLQELLDWFSNSNSGPSGNGQDGERRLTRSMSKGLENRSSSDSLAGDHRQLLVKLMSRGLEARSSSERMESAAAAAMAAAAAAGVIGGSTAAGGAPTPAGNAALAPSGSARYDPMKRTRSSNSRRSSDLDRAAAALWASQQQGAAAAAGGGSGQQQQQQQQQAGAAATAAPGGLGAAGAPGSGFGKGRSGGGGPSQPASLSLPMPDPTPLSQGGLSDVFVTPTFSSQEIALLIEALNQTNNANNKKPPT